MDNFQALLPDLMLYASIAGIAYALFLYYKASKSKSWPKVVGTITKAEKGTETTQMRHGNMMSKVYKADISYQYKVANKIYRSNKLCIGPELKTSFEHSADRFLKKYPEGSEVSVYYNPINPSDCCLERRADGAWFYLAVCIAMAIFSRFLA